MAGARVEMMEVWQCNEKHCRTFGRRAADAGPGLFVCTVHRVGWAVCDSAELRCECGKMANLAVIDVERTKALQWCGATTCISAKFKMHVLGDRHFAEFIQTPPE
jgi:hypothetical protein